VQAMSSPGEWYEWALSFGEPRVKDWLLMNPMHVLGLIGAYLLVIFTLKTVMESRPKMKMKAFAIVHNITLALVSLYMFVEILRQALINGYSIWGNGVDHGPRGEGMARVLHIFFLSKVLEFNDTVLMCLKKNFHQISFLHVYHHTSIFAIWWVIVYYAPGGEGYFSAMLNSFIHVLMYSYYLWTTLTSEGAEKLSAVERDATSPTAAATVTATAADAKPRRKPTWREPAYYKEWMTRMQIIQFVSMLTQSIYDLIVPNAYPRFCIWILFYYMFTMLALFGNFYYRSYRARAAAKKAAKGK